ncbi:hypothetical protein D3C87_2021050 [compost metagenome]
MKDTMIGIDLAMNTIVLHGTSMTGDLQFRKKLSRGQFVQFMLRHPALRCRSGSLWQRSLLGARIDGLWPRGEADCATIRSPIRKAAEK